jgi:hypothetical protein
MLVEITRGRVIKCVSGFRDYVDFVVLNNPAQGSMKILKMFQSVFPALMVFDLMNTSPVLKEFTMNCYNHLNEITLIKGIILFSKLLIPNVKRNGFSVLFDFKIRSTIWNDLSVTETFLRVNEYP